MRKTRKVAAALAALAMAAAPAAANPADPVGGSYTARGTAGFAGINLTLRGDRGAVVPRARLAIGFDHIIQDGSSAARARTVRASTVELGFSSLGKPDLYIAGQRLADVQTRLGIAPAGAALLAVGGLAVVGVAVASASGGEKKPPEVVCLGVGVCPPLPPAG
jgi:hypothetical protein